MIANLSMLLSWFCFKSSSLFMRWERGLCCVCVAIKNDKLEKILKILGINARFSTVCVLLSSSPDTLHLTFPPSISDVNRILTSNNCFFTVYDVKVWRWEFLKMGFIGILNFDDKIICWQPNIGGASMSMVISVKPKINYLICI